MTASQRPLRSPRMAPILGVLLVCLAAGLAGCAAKHVAASKAFSYACAAGGECAVYLTLTNPGRQADALVGVETEVAARAEMHKLTSDEQGGMLMQAVENIPLPASTTVDLEPGGRHLMLVGLTRALKTGETFDLKLLYAKGGEESVQVVVMPEN